MCRFSSVSSKIFNLMSLGARGRPRLGKSRTVPCSENFATILPTVDLTIGSLSGCCRLNK